MAGVFFDFRLMAESHIHTLPRTSMLDELNSNADDNDADDNDSTDDEHRRGFFSSYVFSFFFSYVALRVIRG